MIVVVDYGVGNLRSVENMLRKAGAAAVISGDPEQIAAADKLVLPGVGHFGHGIAMLRKAGVVDSLEQVALHRKKPVLGICLGAQIIGRHSEEGDAEGLGWLDMDCRRFPETPGYRVPHMGWSGIALGRACPLFPDPDPEARYYFVHSYRMVCEDEDDVVATTEYGVPYTSVVQRGNIFGTQFHPEKSHRFGLALMRAFNEL